MHELAIAESILKIAEEELRSHGCTRLKSLKVTVGVLSGVVPESLKFGFDALVRGTVHEGAALEIIPIPLKLRCGSCGAEFEGEREVGELSPCPSCGEMLGHSVLTGKELQVSWLEGE